MLLARKMLMGISEAGGWDLSTASYDGVSYSVSSEDSAAFGVTFKDDGTKMYMVGETTDTIYQYTLSTAWDVSTASYDSKSRDIGSETLNPTEVTFGDSGSKMFVTERGDKSVLEYDVPTPWDISSIPTGSADGSLLVSSQASRPFGHTFKNDGSKIFVADTESSTIYQYTLSTAWDVSTASYDSKSHDVSTEESGLSSVTFKDDGTKMYVAGFTGDEVNQYTLSTAWDVSTASYDNVVYSVSSEEHSTTGVTFKDDGTKMYIVGPGSNTVYQYSLG